MNEDSGFKSFTVAELADAIEKDGLPQGFGHYFFSDGDIYDGNAFHEGTTITKACALGQACINLGVKVPRIVNWSSNWKGRSLLLARITHLNDGAKHDCKKIADEIRKTFAKSLDEPIMAPAFDYDKYLD